MHRSLSALISLCIVGMLVAMFMVSARRADAQQPQVVNREYDIKAGYFVYFSQLTRWPASAAVSGDQPFMIGILGTNPFGSAMRVDEAGFVSSAGGIPVKPVGGRRVKVVQYGSVAEFERSYSRCDILFVSRSSTAGETFQDRIKAALARTKNKPVLLVSEAVSRNQSQNLARQGVLICLWSDSASNKVRMVINQTAGKQKGLAISARLLRLNIVEVL